MMIDVTSPIVTETAVFVCGSAVLGFISGSADQRYRIALLKLRISELKDELDLCRDERDLYREISEKFAQKEIDREG